MAEKETKEINALIAANMQMNGMGIEIRTIQEAKLLAETFISSNLVPKHFDTPAKIIVAIQAGFELGFKIWQSLNSLHVINGQVGIKSAAIGGLIRSRGKCKMMSQGYEGKKGTEEYCAVVKSMRTDDTTEHESRFSIQDAKQAGLLGKDNWVHYPEDMLMWRALSRHGRTFYGDVLSGFYTVEELQEIHPPAEAPTPDAGSREERKQVDAKIVDTAEAVKEQLEKCLTKFVGCAEYSLENKLDNVPSTMLNELFAKFAWLILNPDNAAEAPDYRNIESYTLENLANLMVILEQDGIPQDILALFPTPPMTEKEVTKKAKEKLSDYKWSCNSVACNVKFDKPKGTKNNPICPVCLTANISKNESVEAKQCT